MRALDERIVKAMQAYRRDIRWRPGRRMPAWKRPANIAPCWSACGRRPAALREQFKSLLNENTIREVANFQSQLNRERETIRERIETINGSLRAIDYNPGRYILLEANPNPDQEIRDFRGAARCTEGALAGSEERNIPRRSSCR